MTKIISLTIAIVIIFTSFLFTPKPAYAQTPTTKTNYFDLIKQQMIQLTAGNVTSIKITPMQKPKINFPTPTKAVEITPTTKPLQITVSPTNKVTPTSLPTKTPTPTLILSTAPTSKPTNTPSNDQLTYIMNEINTYRSSQGLSPVSTNTETCNFATTRALEITKQFNHDGFNERIQKKNLPYTTWTKVTENIAMTSNYTQVVTLWKNSAGHAANMRADTPYVCVRNNGNYYAYEGMKP